MSSRNSLQHLVSTTVPNTGQVGDEYFDPSANKLYKRLVINGTTLGYTEIPVLSQPVVITNSSSTFSTVTGALVVAGGVGIGGDLRVGGTLFGNITGSITTASTVNTVQQTSAATHFLTFVDSNTVNSTAKILYTTSSFAILPNSGNVGIGNSSPVAKLQSSGAAQTTPTGGSVTGAGLYINNTDTAYGMMFGVASTGIGWIQQQRSDSNIQYDLTLNPIGGNVGIGINTPTSKLHVSGTTQISGVTTVTNTTSATSTITGALQVSGGAGIGGNLWATQLRQTSSAIAIGTSAGASSQNAIAVAIGSNAGQTSQGLSAVAIGNQAGNSNQTSYGVAIGEYAGNSGQGDSGVAIGNGAGQTTQGSSAVAIGSLAGNSTQGNRTVAIGSGAGQTSQTQYGVALGYNAGQTSQGSSAVALGLTAGQTNQATSAVAIGNAAGNTTQGISAISIGANAGQNTQTQYAVAIGYQAGQTLQGDSAIAIGKQAGTSSQPANSIIINASGSALNGTNTGTYITPIRADASTSATSNLVYYNPATRELTTGTIAAFGGNAATVNTISRTTNATHFLTFVDSNNTSTTAELLYTTSSVVVNPSTGEVDILSNLASTSTITGALVVTGGVGIGRDLWVGAGVYATTKSFLIPHPTKAGMKLRYGSLEGPENGIYVRGKLTGANIIELPEYWTKLIDTDSITVNLTPLGRHQNLYVESIADNKVIVGNSNLLNKDINCFYTVFAERRDVEKLQVEIY